MKIYTFFNNLTLFIFLIPYFVKSFSSFEPSTEGLYKGFRTLWKPYTQTYYIRIRHRNQSVEDIPKNFTAALPKTRYVTIDWDYKQLFMNNDYDYDKLSPNMLEIIKRKMLNKEVINKALYSDHAWRRQLDENSPPVNSEIPWRNEYSLSLHPATNTSVTSATSTTELQIRYNKEGLRQDIPTTEETMTTTTDSTTTTTVTTTTTTVTTTTSTVAATPCPDATTTTTTATRDPRRPWTNPTKWETPEPHKTIIWSWTTTEATKSGITKEQYHYYDPHYPYYEDFYTYLRRNYAKVGGTTVYSKPLPTLEPVFGTTFIWRFWSYNRHFENVETFLALETEVQPTTTRHRTTTLANIRNASCYVCGLNLPGIPRMAGCHHIFGGKDGSSRLGMDRFKKRCLTGRRWQAPRGRNWYGELYRGGCFKRFTDVGVEFEERGCRTMEPTRGYNFASKRFARLEKTLYDVDNGCVFSPNAMLTPFSRAISLYVRYHVCVCTGKYCNNASRAHPLHILIITQFLSMLLYLLRIKTNFLKTYLFIFVFTCGTCLWSISF